MKRFLTNEDGWTFMETLVVIAIVMILTAGVGYMGIGSLEKARVAGARSQIDSICVALESYYIDMGCYPTTEQGLAALRKRPDESSSAIFWNGPYMYKDVPKDPWGNDYEYLSPGVGELPYTVRCFGADGKEGGELKNSDITSWEN